MLSEILIYDLVIFVCQKVEKRFNDLNIYIFKLFIKIIYRKIGKFIMRQIKFYDGKFSENLELCLSVQNFN